jgi:hypothetical protein
MQQAPPAYEWYRAHEWNLDVWGAYAISGNQGTNDFRRTSEFDGPNVPEDTGTPAGAGDPNQLVDIGQAHNDRFLNSDGRFGGGADIKYFFSRYWGIGFNGFVVDANDNIGGGIFSTATIRYPIGNSRFAPYAWAGLGGVGGGSTSSWYFFETHHINVSGNGVHEREGRTIRTANETRTEVAGQFGGGLEVRLTKHIGFMSDFCWNMLNRPDNDFGMARFGVTLAY